MAGTYNKEEWLKKSKLVKEEAMETIDKVLESYQSEPEQIIEALRFGSKFYNYSVRNQCLIQNQNPYANYVQSFNEWKKQGVKVNKGAKGLKILVPTTATLLKVEGEWITKSKATKEQLSLLSQGKLESTQRTSFSVGNVFDIAQTDFPVEKYPELYHMGYSSEAHQEVAKGMVDYCIDSLDCEVEVKELDSISLRGYYTPSTNSITLNDKLNDTQALSTLIHEMGHAVLHKELPEGDESKIEIEADAFALMVENSCGIEVTESRSRHLVNHYKTFTQGMEPEVAKKETEALLKNVFNRYKENIDDIQKAIENHLSKEKSPYINVEEEVKVKVMEK